jgi:hypothetical protein
LLCSFTTYITGVSIKKTGRWSASPVITEKRYLYMTELLKKIVTVVFIETPVIYVVKEQSNMLDYEIYYFVGALSLTIL